jgi:secondary thiamine-phosphate synthase enzyme|tara:strand:+ start:3736 stop:4155 length:420 start_codon:yes stop_codon:yes gene_type:complete
VVVTVRHQLETAGQGDAHDLTRAVTAAVAESGLANGTATVCVVGSTAAVTTLEFEPGVVADLGRACEQIAPRNVEYQHHLRWGDDNGSSHVRAAILGPSVTIPVVDRALTLGTWQQLTLVELDTGPRSREVVIQIVGER